MKHLALILIALFLLIGEADATDKYWVGGGATTNWNATGNTNWALTSGGSNNAAVPVAGDAVFFDGSSGTGASVWNTSISLTGLNATGSKNPVSHSAGVTITLSSGNLVLPTGVGGTYTALGTNSIFTFTGTSGTQQITTNTFKPGSITFNGTGGTFQLQDNLALLASSATAAVTLTTGTFDAQAFTITAAKFVGSGASARALVGSGLWTLGQNDATGTLWNSNTTAFTITSFTSSITFVANAALTDRTLAFGGNVFAGTLTIGASTGSGAIFITGTNTFGNLSITGPNYIIPTFSTTLTLTNAPTITGTANSPITFTSSNTSNPTTISVASGTPTFTWVALRDMTFSGGATFTANNSFNLGDNTGITINAPSGGGGCILGGWLLWRDLPNHINDNYPAWIDQAA